MPPALLLRAPKSQSEQKELKTVIVAGEFEKTLAEIRDSGGILKAANGEIVGIIVPHPKYELLVRAAYIARHPEYLVDLLKRKLRLEKDPHAASLTLEEAFGDVEEQNYEFSP